MTIHFPDVSNYNSGYQIPPSTPFLWAKASEGTTYKDPLFKGFRDQAKLKGVRFGGYHWLWAGNEAAQAANAFAMVGSNIPLFVDVEETQSTVRVNNILNFVKEYRQLGGIVHPVYLPHWYWQDHMGSPDLTPLRTANLWLIASEYRSYSDTNWPLPYGGIVPFQWQYTSTPIDMNAFIGTVDEYWSLVTTGVIDMAGVLTDTQRDYLIMSTQNYLYCLFEGIDADGAFKAWQDNGTRVGVPNSIHAQLKTLADNINGVAGWTDADRQLVTNLTNAMTELTAELQKVFKGA